MSAYIKAFWNKQQHEKVYTVLISNTGKYNKKIAWPRINFTKYLLPPGGESFAVALLLLTCRCIPPSGALLEMRVTLHRASNPFLQTDHRSVGQVFFGPFTAVVVVGSGQGHSHRCERGFEGNQRAQDQGHQPEQQGESINEHVGEVVARGSISKTNQYLWHEIPESNGLVVGNMVGLRSHSEWKSFICGKTQNSEFSDLTEFRSLKCFLWLNISFYFYSLFHMQATLVSDVQQPGCGRALHSPHRWNPPD